MFRFNKQYSKEKEEDDVLLTERLSDQNSLSQTQGSFLKKLQVKKTTNKQTKKSNPNKTKPTVTMGSAWRKTSNAELRSYSAGKQ